MVVSYEREAEIDTYLHTMKNGQESRCYSVVLR